jgi:ribonuclease T1
MSDLPGVAYAELPPEAHVTLRLIDAGGPFPFRQDDTTFQNRERLLPRHPEGYYREYTVVTPGADTRGARRIVAGRAGELYYTDDHYDSFREIIR